MTGLEEIHAAVADGLALVEETLKAVARVDYPLLAQLVAHVLRPGGKRIRPSITLLAGKLFDYRLDKLVPMASAMELLHTATLVHDDVLDRSEVRRGQPTINSVASAGTAVLVGDYLFAKSADLVASTENLRAMTLFARTLMVICTGELRQAFGAKDPNSRREDYFKWVEGKTAALFATAAESGGILSGAPEPALDALRGYGYNLGMAFQVVDDILDFSASQEQLGKPARNDLLQGVLTLPTILYLERYPEDGRLRRILEGRVTPAEVDELAEEIRSSGVLADAYVVAEQFAGAARAALESLPDQPARQMLAALIEFTVRRSS